MRPQETGAAPDDSLGNLVAEVLERIEREGTRALEEACAAHPELAGALRKRVLSLRELGLIEAISRDHTPGKLGEFQLVERIGAGGMGVVYHALQTSLGREVALELIRPEILHLPGARESQARDLVASSPGEYASDVYAGVLMGHGAFCAREGRFEEAKAPMEEALRIRRELLESNPVNELARQDVIESESALSCVLMYLGDNAGALALLEQAAERTACNRADFPDAFKFLTTALDVELNRGAVLGRLKRETEARAALEHAAAIAAEILEQRPDLADIHRTLGTTLLNLADSQLAAGEIELALETCGRSLACFENAIAMLPKDPDVAAWLAPERSTRAKILLAQDKIAEAAEVLAEAPRLAGHLRDRAISSMKRLVKCVERAQNDGGDEVVQRCNAAARKAIELARARGDLDKDPTVARLVELVGP